jgi:hypothetical protein
METLFQIPECLKYLDGKLISVGTIIRFWCTKILSEEKVNFGFVSQDEIKDIKTFLEEKKIEVSELNVKIFCFIRDMELLPIAGSIYRELLKRSKTATIDSTKNVETLSVELHLPPLLIGNILKRSLSKEELKFIEENDINSKTSMRIISEKSKELEKKTHKRLLEMKIPHETEDELKEQKKQLTPDFYFETPLIFNINGEEKKIKWLDVKNYTFHGNTFFVKKLLEQSKKYNEAFCSDCEIGAMVFSGNVLLLNITKPTPEILKLSRTTLLLNGSSI